MMGIKKDRNTLYITHSGELLLWLVVVFFIVAVSTIIYLNGVKKANDYTIFMQDVDGLIVGSPVRMMGIEVGHVTKIKPTNEEVYIKFIITDKNITIPQGTIATVEFSGMAGSKSLELYLPDKLTYIDKNTPAWKIIQELKLQNIDFNGVCYSDKHANFLINKNNKYSKNIKDLIDLTIYRAKKELNINLELEIQIMENKDE